MRYPELEEATLTIEQALPASIDPAEIAEWVQVRDLLRGYARRFADAAGLLDQAMFEAIPAGETVVSEGQSYGRTGKPSRKAWRTDDLLRVVLDSRKFDTSTGELVDETATDRILAVWNLGAPRTTELKARGIDADEFCTVEWSARGVKEA